MGKQMTYYMEREVFTQLAQIAVDLGCVILKQNGSKIISGDTSIITATARNTTSTSPRQAR